MGGSFYPHFPLNVRGLIIQIDKTKQYFFKLTEQFKKNVLVTKIDKLMKHNMHRIIFEVISVQILSNFDGQYNLHEYVCFMYHVTQLVRSDADLTLFGLGVAFDATQDLNPLLLTNDCVYSVPIS